MSAKNSNHSLQETLSIIMTGLGLLAFLFGLTVKHMPEGHPLAYLGWWLGAVLIIGVGLMIAEWDTDGGPTDQH